MLIGALAIITLRFLTRKTLKRASNATSQYIATNSRMFGHVMWELLLFCIYKYNKKYRHRNKINALVYFNYDSETLTRD